MHVIVAGRVHVVRVRVRLGAGLSRFADAPLLSVDLADGSSVDDLLAELGAQQPSLAPALRAALPVLAGTHVERGQRLEAGDEVALLIPVAGGAGSTKGA
jgi:molybdopterin converting factor small subunit